MRFQYDTHQICHSLNCLKEHVIFRFKIECIHLSILSAKIPPKLALRCIHMANIMVIARQVSTIAGKGFDKLREDGWRVGSFLKICHNTESHSSACCTRRLYQSWESPFPSMPWRGASLAVSRFAEQPGAGELEPVQLVTMLSTEELEEPGPQLPAHIQNTGPMACGLWAEARELFPEETWQSILGDTGEEGVWINLNLK